MPTRTTATRKQPKEDRYLALFHPSKRAQTMAQWEDFVEALTKGQHLISGSALAKPTTITAGKLTAAPSATVDGYMILRAPSLAKARALVKRSPTHLCGGQVDLFPLVRS